MRDGERDNRVDGILTAWNDERGFGFLTTDTGARQIFVHISEFPRASGRPVLGEALDFTIITTSDGRTQATRIGGERMSAAAAVAIPAGFTRSARGRLVARRRPASFDYLAIIGFVLVYVSVSVVWPMPLWVLGVYLLTSILSFLVYASDKRASTTGGWRVSESSLLALGIIGGWPGAIVGQQVFRHKTRKAGFRSVFWGTVVLNALAFVTFSALLSTPLR